MAIEDIDIKSVRASLVELSGKLDELRGHL